MSCIPQPRGLEEKKKTKKWTLHALELLKHQEFNHSALWNGVLSHPELIYSVGGLLCCIPAMYQPQQLCFQGWMQNIRLTYGETWLTVGTIYPGTSGPQYSFFDQGSLTRFTSAGWLRGIPMVPSTSHLLVQVSRINHSFLMATIYLIKAYNFKKSK